MTTRDKTDWRAVHGILLLDKQTGVSSNGALQHVRKLFRAEKGGHTGSLDPLATGLLPICFGEATKIAGLLLGARKAYDAECRLGVATTTGDSEGETLEMRPVPPLDSAAIDAALAPLRGRIRQRPPVYSAIKQGGEPLYRRARRGEAVEAPTREVVVDRFERLGRDGDTLRLHVECGSGTYVRSLVRDLGEALGCGAHVTALRRLWVEPFTAPAMATLEQVEAAAARGDDALESLLLPLEAGLPHLPRFTLDAREAAALRDGQKVFVRCAQSGTHLAFDATGRPIALAEIGGDGCARCTRGLNLPPREAA